MYHDLDERRSPISITPARFTQQMTWLHEHGYRVLPLGRLVAHLRHATPLPARSVAITFDDGFESVARVAFPILAHFGFPATVFVVSATAGGRMTGRHNRAASRAARC
jgi:peptidoglycan/xylan/chitin deacetylase (PgdA/CDA1 family)